MVNLRHVRAAYGTVLVLAPDTVLRRVVGIRDPDRRLHAATRVLGGRQLAEGVLPRRARRLLVVIDAIHVHTMVGLALIDARRRRATLASAGVAAGFGVATLANTRTGATS